tara:strand:+ start:7175 stop:7495 length:321 start_codon:yes stop_codon:yes gene_type:complete
MTSIQGGVGKVTGSNDNLAIAVQDVQTIVIQCRENDSFLAYSESGLTSDSTRIKLSQFASSASASGLVLTFPTSPFSGTLWFSSTSAVTASKIIVWSVQCGSGGLY